MLNRIGHRSQFIPSVAMKKTFDISSLKQLTSVAAALQKQSNNGDLIFLQGDLGSGKTTFTQLFLKAAGVKEPVKSPTYSLFESYQSPTGSYVHMDLYRLSDPEELYFLGIEEILDGSQVVLIEWPSKAEVLLPPADLILQFEQDKLNRTLTVLSK